MGVRSNDLHSRVGFSSNRVVTHATDWDKAFSPSRPTLEGALRKF